MKICRNIFAFALMALFMAGCSSIVDDRIPAVNVYINLGNTGLWNTFGVSGFGVHREFVRQLGIPSNFNYTANTYTGFGGVLLIGGMNPYTADTNVPLAYDLACPVECKPDVRVFVDDETMDAVCPVCGSHYNVTMAGGAPVSGPAVTMKYKLQSYMCLGSEFGGYIITRR